ncbi:M14 family metallopeptidase [Engelhardtia mirabilis]|uniref:Zinc carboxypeptidase n=1 Tax=Engelhardtia mirabilis TaxID=2528011 RepID=A0A518BJA4_9BACT|nr:Zinc carboxypeptidase [Planctomycetes bacterium Pla133]QDV01387.1 Zinc carboxypeptidase [Planctomycetes bacterium Pla86]
MIATALFSTIGALAWPASALPVVNSTPPANEPPAAGASAGAPVSAAQDSRPAGFPGLAAGRAPQVEIPWNRLYGPDEIDAHFARLAARWPNLLSAEVIGTSSLGRTLRVWTLNDPATGQVSSKPTMWIDGNVHGNEVQASETVLYTAWYLLENRDSNERVHALLERASFHLMPSINPDGRGAWFEGPATASMFRSGQLPTDDDLDGLFDEDPPNDLDGDGNITSMRKFAPGRGNYRLDPNDPRIMVRLGPDEEPGDWLMLGREGIDDDGDGRANEDDAGGYDMNRAWPSGWQPEHVQGGAGAYPLFWPETRSVAEYIAARPNIAAAQSFHNSGGMILRGPGFEDYGNYPRSDVAVYDALGADGEKMLPFYNYWIIWRDLYSVFGGFVNWTYEGLGIISFTNELWAGERNSPDERLGNSTEDRHFFDDTLLMGAGFTDWTPYDHPLYGEVEIGGFAKDVGRVPPSFLIEEELHRNALFCIRHAEAMPRVTIDEPELTDLGDGIWAVDLRFRNEAVIPTRSAMAAQKHVGLPDVIEFAGAGIEVLAAGRRTDRWRPERLDLVEHSPERVVREDGIDGKGELELRWIVRGSGPVEVRYTGEKIVDVSREFSLGD